MGDIPIIDDLKDLLSLEGKELFIAESLNEYKKVINVSFNKELNIISAMVESVDSEFAPLPLIIDRLKSLNDKDAYELAQTVEKYSKIVKNCTPPFEISESPPLKNQMYLDFCGKIKDFYQSNSEIPMLALKCQFKKRSRALEITQLDFNKSLTMLLENSVEDFSLKAFESCIPKFMVMDMNYYEFFNILLHNCTVSKVQNSPDFPMSLIVIMKNQRHIKMRVKVDMDYFISPIYSEIFISFRFIYDKPDQQIKSFPTGDNLTAAKRQCGIKEMVECEKLGPEEIAFLERFYPGSIQKP